MTQITGGDVIARTLASAGVKAIFALHGAHVDTIFQAAAQNGIRLIDMRHEAAVGHAAEGYARVTRGLGVAVVTAGPGFTNCLSSMANAFTDGTPVLYIAGAPDLSEAQSNGLQSGVDPVAMATPVTKWAHQITRPEDIARLVAHAVRVATTAPTGPVFLSVPTDVIGAMIADGGQSVSSPIVDSPAWPAPNLVEAARELLASAERPVILVGREAWYANAGGALRVFAETTGIPVFSDFAAHGLIPADHPLYGGTGHKLAYVGADRPDLVLALGVKFGLFTLGDGAMLFPADAKVIHVTVDGAELGKVRRADVAVAADARAMLEMLNAAPPAMNRAAVDAWAATVRAAVPARHALLNAEADGHNGPIHPWPAVKAVAAAAADHILVADGAEAYHWLNEALAQKQAGSYLTHGHFGCMGIGLGLAVGAQVAAPTRRVMLLTGDGAFGFTIAELDTLARHDLPVVVVVTNNHSWGASQRFQDGGPPERRVVATTLGDARYDRVAAGFGCDGVRVTDLVALAPALDAAFASGRPTVIDVRVDYAPPAPELALMVSGRRH